MSTNYQGSVLLAVLLLASLGHEEASALVSTTSNGKGEMTTRRMVTRMEGRGQGKQTSCDGSISHSSAPSCFAQFTVPNHLSPQPRLRSVCLVGLRPTIMAQTPRPMLPYEDPLRSRFVGSCARRTSGVALRMSVEDEIQRLREEGKKEQAKDAEEEQLRVVLKQLWEGLEQREAVKAQV